MKQAITVFMLMAMLLTDLGASSGKPEKLISYNFTGTVIGVVDTVECPLGKAFADGDAVKGTFTYDFDTPDAQPDPYLGVYLFATPPSVYSVTINGFTFENGPDVMATVQDASFEFGTLLLPISSLPGLDPKCISDPSSALIFLDGSIIDDCLPSFIDLADFDYTEGTVFFGDTFVSETVGVRFSLDTL